VSLDFATSTSLKTIHAMKCDELESGQASIRRLYVGCYETFIVIYLICSGIGKKNNNNNNKNLVSSFLSENCEKPPLQSWQKPK
jgi:hypothetical protein